MEQAREDDSESGLSWRWICGVSKSLFIARVKEPVYCTCKRACLLHAFHVRLLRGRNELEKLDELVPHNTYAPSVPGHSACHGR
eukprot:3334238-Rhodomonas_salina.1